MQTKITIVGGGTAGWLAALMLSHVAKNTGRTTDICVIESSKIPTIGVGEGTTAVFRIMLQALGIDEFEFIRETGATLKLGIAHQDWKQLGHIYYGPIDNPAQLSPQFKDDRSELINQYALSRGNAVANTHGFDHLMRAGKVPYQLKNGKLSPSLPFHYAFHFDQAKVGHYLKRKAIGIRCIDAVVNSVNLGADGQQIESLSLDNDTEHQSDLWIDCTGFAKRLIRELPDYQWLSYQDRLPVNRAMPFWLPHGDTIAPYTLSRALKYGWMWAIPTADRMGCGYVYNDQISSDQAQAEVETLLGHPIEPRRDLAFDSGRLTQQWIGNCIALGLSSSFLEPLEATSIHGTVVQLMLLTDQSALDTPEQYPEQARRFNALCSQQVDDFANFINLHYVSNRQDSPFWQSIANYRSDSTSKLLSTLETTTPKPYHFRSLKGMPHVGPELYWPVLDGLGLLDAKIAKQELANRPAERKLARDQSAQLEKLNRSVAAQCLRHETFIDQVTRNSIESS